MVWVLWIVFELIDYFELYFIPELSPLKLVPDLFLGNMENSVMLLPLYCLNLFPTGLDNTGFKRPVEELQQCVFEGKKVIVDSL